MNTIAPVLVMGAFFTFAVLNCWLLERQQADDLAVVKNWVEHRGGKAKSLTRRRSLWSAYNYKVTWLDAQGQEHVVKYADGFCGGKRFRESS